jgi:hypothetical protein
LFTEVEGSTRLLEELGAELYSTVLQLHRRLLRAAFATPGGYEVDEGGDARPLVRVTRWPGVCLTGRSIPGERSMRWS